MVGRIIRWLLALGIISVAALITTAVWRFSDEVRAEMMQPPVFGPAYPSVDVESLGDGTALLRLGDGALTPGSWGVRGPNGYARLGTVGTSQGDVVPRDFVPVVGSFTAGMSAALDPVAYRGDPLTALGMPYEDTAVPGEDGNLPAWYIAGESATWIIAVHGLPGREDVLRFLPVFRDLGHPVLAVSLRGDPGAPAPTGDRFRWGFEEWRDVEAAIRHALAAGADNVVLFGVGTGGSTVAMTLRESDESRFIEGAILDSPIVDVAAVEEGRVQREGIGGAIAEWGRALAAFRFGMEWTLLDQISNAAAIRKPVLVIHGSKDSYVPFELAESFVAALGERGTLHRVDDALHAGTWNHDPDGYAAAVATWLTSVLQEPTIEE